MDIHRNSETANNILRYSMVTHPEIYQKKKHYKQTQQASSYDDYTSQKIKALEIIYDIIPLNLHCQYKALASLQRNQEVIKLNWRGESQK